jgi:death on curing protein
VIYLTLPELLHVAGRTLGPDYSVRDIGLLEAALARPRATAFGKDAYPDLDTKAAALLHSIARNHALIDGNKRLALAAVIAFYGLNGRRLTLTKRCRLRSGNRRCERVADLDALVCLTRVEILRVQDSAAEFFRAAQDHRVPEGRSGVLVDIDGREDVAAGGSVHVPVSQIADDPCGRRGIERLRDLSCRGDKELLQHLNAQAALPAIPQLLD